MRELSRNEFEEELDIAALRSEGTGEYKLEATFGLEMIDVISRGGVVDTNWYEGPVEEFHSRVTVPGNPVGIDASLLDPTCCESVWNFFVSKH